MKKLTPYKPCQLFLLLISVISLFLSLSYHQHHYLHNLTHACHTPYTTHLPSYYSAAITVTYTHHNRLHHTGLIKTPPFLPSMAPYTTGSRNSYLLFFPSSSAALMRTVHLIACFSGYG